MSLGDMFTPGDAKRAPKKAAAVEIPRFSMRDAAIRLHKAMGAPQGADIDAIEDALRHGHAAYEDEQETKPDKD